MRQHIIITAFSLCLAFTGAGRAFGEPTKASVDKVLEFWQAEGFLGDAVGGFEAAVARKRKEVSVSETQSRLMLSLGKRIYPGKNLIKVFKANYAKAIPPDAVQALWAWMNTPGGIRLRKGLQAAYKLTPQARQETFDRESPTVLKPNRKNALHTFLVEWQQDHLYTVMQSGLDLAVAMALNTYQPPATRETPKALKDKAMTRRVAYLEDGRTAALTLDFVVMGELKNEEIDDLTKFAGTAAGQAHIKAMAKALEATLDGAAVTMAKQVTTETGNK